MEDETTESDVMFQAETDAPGGRLYISSREQFNEGELVLQAGHDGSDDAKPAVLKLCMNGDIFVNGRLAENDKEVVECMRAVVTGLVPRITTKQVYVLAFESGYEHKLEVQVHDSPESATKAIEPILTERGVKEQYKLDWATTIDITYPGGRVRGQPTVVSTRG